MSEFLWALLSLTLGGGLAALLLAAISRVRRAPVSAAWRCVLWAALCLRLAVPVAPGLPALFHLTVPAVETPAGSAGPAIPGDSGTVSPPHAGEGTIPSGPSTPSGTVVPENPQDPQDPPASPGPAPGGRDTVRLSAVRIIFGLWAAGAAGMGAWLLGGHLRFLRYRRRWAKPVEDPETLAYCDLLTDRLGLRRRPRLMRCPGLRSPMLAGLLRPVLLLPEEPMPPEELRYALLHEFTHCRRKDLWIRALTLWVNLLHWFNPLMWLLVRWAEGDMELACDGCVLRSLPPEEYRAYGRTLLELASKNKVD